MHICHVISSVDAKSGGPPLIATRLAAAQAALGHDVHLLSYHPDSLSSSIAAKLPDLPGGDKVRVHLAGKLSRYELLTGKRAGQALLPLVRSFDFLHLHGLWEGILWTSSTIARNNNIPYTVVPHGMLDPWCLSQGALKKKLSLALFDRSMLDHAAFLHLGNTDEQRLIQPLGLKAPPEIIPNGVFLEEFEHLPEPGSFYASHPELQDQPFVLFLSRLHYKKGLDYLADAFALAAAQHPNLRLVVAGPDGGYQATFEQMIARHSLQARTHLVGPLLGREKLAAFRDAACFCLPSRQEGFSIAITEALACGTPAVVSADCHYPEVASVGAGEVTPLDAHAIAQGILRAIDPARREQLSAAGQRLIRERFNWPAAARIAVECYQRAISRRTPRVA